MAQRPRRHDGNRHFNHFVPSLTPPDHQEKTERGSSLNAETWVPTRSAARPTSTPTSPGLLALYGEEKSPPSKHVDGWPTAIYPTSPPLLQDDMLSPSWESRFIDPFGPSLEVEGPDLWEFVSGPDIHDLPSPPAPSSEESAAAEMDYGLDLDGFNLDGGKDATGGDPHDLIDEDGQETLSMMDLSPSSVGPVSVGVHGEPRFRLPGQLRPRPSDPEMLLRAFDRSTCGILSIRDGPHENPWRTAILPLVRESEVVFTALACMVAFHQSKGDAAMRVIGLKFMHRSINLFREHLATMRPDLALASTLILAFAESWDVHVSTGIRHLQGARACIRQAQAQAAAVRRDVGGLLLVP